MCIAHLVQRLKCFSEWMEKLFSNVNQKLLFICGDLDIDLLNATRLKANDDFSDTMYSMSLYQTITKPSRITSHSATLIDNVFTNVMEIPMRGLLICDITDHLPIFSLYNCQFKKNKGGKNVCFKRKRTEETITAFNNSLKDQDWSPVVTNSNVDKAYDDFMHICVSLYKYCPVIKYSNSKISTKKWLTKGILNACKKKQNLYRLSNKKLAKLNIDISYPSIHPSAF